MQACDKKFVIVIVFLLIIVTFKYNIAFLLNMEVEVEAKRMGGSIGIIIPKDIVEQENILPKEKIRIEIKKKHTVGDLFGLLKDWKTPTSDILKEARKGWM